MANLETEFDESQHGDMASFDPIPPAKYEAMITDSDMNPTQAGDLNQLKLTWQITSGQYEGRYIWIRINLPHRDHPASTLEAGKQKALEIGAKELATICRALGKQRIADSAELHHIPCEIDVRIKPAGKSKTGVFFNASNEIRGYHQVGQLVGAGATAPAPAQAQPPRQVATEKKAPPWAKK